MYSYRKIGQVSLPIILGLLAQNVIQITDTILMGRVGEAEFGATGLAGIYYIAFFMLAFGFSIGCQILISRRNGEKKYEAIGGIVIHSILFLIVLAAILYFASAFITRNYLPRFIKSPEISEAAISYLDWRTIGFFFSFINVIFRAFYVGIIRTSVLTLNAIVMALVNFFAAYGLIFGNLGLPQMGIAGAGLASVIAEASSILFFIFHTYATIDLKKYGFRIKRFDFSIIRKVFHISVFTMIQYFASLATWFLFFMAIENHGERDLAITNIIRTFYMIFFIPMNALSTTANTLVSNTIGEGRAKEVLPLVYRISKMNLVIVLIMAIIAAIAPEFWISFIVSKGDISLISETVKPLYVLLFALPICSIATVMFNSVSGTGNTQIGLLFELSTLVVYVMALWFIVIHLHSSVAICWTVEYIYWGILMILSFIYLKWGNWQKKQI
ncbi:MAG: MATE family efflux transporter [Dysgonamonadaceae bacterium]